MNRRLQGGCQVPIGAYAELDSKNQLWLRGLVGSLDGRQLIRHEVRGSAEQAETMGQQLAEVLLQQGAAEILAAVYQSRP